jgi:hypothetical protein
LWPAPPPLVFFFFQFQYYKNLTEGRQGPKLGTARLRGCRVALSRGMRVQTADPSDSLWAAVVAVRAVGLLL